MQDKLEVWQVQVNGQIYEATFQELTEWIAERSLLPTDMVRKKDLRWTQADRIPALQTYFAGGSQTSKNQLTPAAAVPPAPKETAKKEAVTEQASVPIIDKGFEIPSIKAEQKPANAASPQTTAEFALNFSTQALTVSDPCHFHKEAEAAYVCKQCREKFCKGCPKAYGAVKICPLCGYFCETYVSEEKAEAGKAGKYKKGSAEQSRTSFDIFGTALAYPFKHPLSFVSIALFYAVLSLAAYFGALAAFLFGIISFAIVFGYCSRIVEQVSRGDLDANYVSSGGDFSVGESFLQPALLGTAVYLVSWLPFSLVSFLLANTVGDIAQIVNRENHPSVGSVFLLGIFAVITFMWGVFYFPAALAIAGYTKSFRETINPLVGFDIIRRMGQNFWQSFLMYFVLIVAAACLFFVVGVITAPLASALGIGNLPAIFLNSIVSFYLYAAAACIFGYALYQSKDRLGSKF